MKITSNDICDYGCGKKAFYTFKNGKSCCEKNWQQCSGQKNKLSKIHKNISKETRAKMSKSQTGRIAWNKGIPHTLKTIEKIRNASKKENISIETTRKRRASSLMENNPAWKGGYSLNNIPTYDSYADKISYADKTKRNDKDSNILDVSCSYCGKWFIPSLGDVISRVRCLNGTMQGESRLYCSIKCKNECPIFNKKIYPDGFKISSSREVQPELRQMRFKIDNYTCQRCGKHQDELDSGLHCHHIEGIRWEPLESADLDKVITLCKDCHKEVHKIEGCGYNDMKCKKE